MERNVRKLLAATLFATTLGASGAALAGQQPAATPPGSALQSGPVEVYWAEPATFSEVRLSMNPRVALQGDWVSRLADHLRDEAARRLPAGERMEVVIKDVDRAGELTAGHGTRVMRDLTAPMIKLSYVHRDANGEVVDYGERTLRDLSYLHGPASVDLDPLRYEKRLLDRWLSKALPAA